MRFGIYFTDSEFNRVSELNYSDSPLLLTARGIAASPIWARMPKAELRVRLSPPEIEVTGQFDSADVARLKALAWQTKHALTTLRYVRYSDIEADCQQLLANLQERFDLDLLKTSYYTCIPRGGLIVLGVLSYLLGLNSWQFRPPPNSEVPIIVVDDCALKGIRFAEFLRSNQSEHIIFAPLYSSLELRTAIEAKEPRVKACISARDLTRYGFPSEEDQRRFKEIFKSEYWVGLTEYICFAWNEPDFTFWNPVNQQAEGTWIILPHEVCLKNGPPFIPVNIQKDIQREYRINDALITLCQGNSLTIEHLITGERYILKGTAAEMWNILLEKGSRSALIEEFLKEYEIDDVTLQSDVSEFINNLLARGILKNE